MIQGQMCVLGKYNTTLKKPCEEHGHVQKDSETKEMNIALLGRKESEDTLSQRKQWKTTS